MNRISLAVILAISACAAPGGDEDPFAARPGMVPYCDKEQSAKLTEWVQKCIADANPQSDEDPEDWIRECKRTGIELLCPMVPSVVFAPCDGCFRVERSCPEMANSNYPELVKSYCNGYPNMAGTR